MKIERTIPEEVRKEHNEACKVCPTRKRVARIVDMHFDWIDCPYNCPNDYEHWLKECES